MKSRLSTESRKNAIMGYLMIAPFCIMFALFKLYPLVYGFVVSFLDRNSIKKATSNNFVGLQNFVRICQSSTFWQAFLHSFIFSLVYTVTIMVLGFVFAVLFNKKFKGRTLVRTFFYMPYVTNMIAVGVIFKYLLNPSRGPVNAIFRMFGWEGPQWLSGQYSALPTTALIAAWAALAFNIITNLAALQDIPVDLFEVADIEVATFIQRMRYIIFPMLIPTLFMLLTITVINSFKNYGTIVALTNGGPGTSSRVLSYQIYDDAFKFAKYSIASAEGVIFTGAIVIISRLISFWRSSWEKKQ